MANLLPTLSDNGYKNWVKGGLGLKYAREGIENFVVRNIDIFHKDVLACLPVGQPYCYNCSTDNIIKCTKGNNTCCKSNKNQCRPCPNSVCNIIRDEIVDNHRFPRPSWANTDASRWCREPWQLAMCYMPPGYATANSAPETDFPGILSVVINNEVFDAVVTDMMSDKNNVFCKARDARNSILHKANMRLTDAELAGHIATLDDMLSDTKCLAGDQNAITAKVFLQQILNDTIHITTQDEQEVRAEALRDDAMREIEDKRKEVLQCMDEKKDLSVSVIQEERDDATIAVKSKRTEAVSAIQEQRDDATVAVKSERTEAVSAIQEQRDDATIAVKSERTEAVSAIQEQRDDATIAVKSERTEAVSAIQEQRDDAMVAVKSERTEAVSAIKEERDDATVAVKSERTQAVSAIQEQRDDATVAVKSERTEAVSAIQEQRDDATIAVKSERTEAVSAIQEQRDDATVAVKSERTEAVSAIQEQRDDAMVAVKSERTEAVSAIKEERDDATVAVKSERTQAVSAIQEQRVDATIAVKSERTEAVSAIQEQRDDATVAVKSERTQAVTAIKEERDDATVSVKSERTQAVTAIQEQRDDATVALKSERTQSVSAIKETRDDATVAVKSETDKAIAASVAAVLKAEEEATSRLESALKISHDQNKKDLKKELLSVYLDGEHMSTSLGPIAADEDKHIEDLYVDPSMKHDGVPVQSYQDIFKVGNKKIYIVGEAGTGKTSLCQKIVSTWCHINTKQKGNMSDNQKAMAKFDYLFYISLRHVITENNIDEMIKHHLLPNKPNLHAPLSRVLDEEKCLIILDGLDEWTTENKTAKSAQVNRGLPGRDAIRNCTVLTTTRPWKLESLQLKSTQIDTKVKLLGIDEISSKQLIQNMITHLNDKFHKRKTYEDFITDTHDKKLDKLTSIPVVLKQIVCLWHGGKQLGKNKTAIYCQMLELLLELAKNRLDKDSQYLKKKEEWKKSSIKLHSCFGDNETCQDVMPLLVAIAELAFLTLLNGEQESSLVLKSSREGCHNLSPEEVNICLKIGILSKDKFLVDCTSRYTKITFLHKSFQEFLAAVYVSLKPKQCVETFKSFCNTYAKCREMSNVLTFISGMCTSATTCTLVQHYNDTKSYGASISGNIVNCMREGWTCSHDNKHLYCDVIYMREPSEYLDQLCKVNIPNIKKLVIVFPPTSQCLQHLLQIHKLEELVISSQRHSPISEDLLYDLIHHYRHTLTEISIWRMTLRSNTRLSTLIPQVQQLLSLSIWSTTLPQQLMTSIHALHTDTQYRRVNIYKPTIHITKCFIKS